MYFIISRQDGNGNKVYLYDRFRSSDLKHCIFKWTKKKENAWKIVTSMHADDICSKIPSKYRPFSEQVIDSDYYSISTDTAHASGWYHLSVTFT